MAHFEGRDTEGKALLETDSLIFRGDGLRLNIPYREMQSISATDGNLAIEFARGVASFALGPDAAKWLHAIRNPKSRLDKLGVKAHSLVAVLGAADRDFLNELNGRTARATVGEVPSGAEIVFLFIGETVSELNGLADLRARIEKGGAIWVIYLKGQKQPTQNDVMSAAKRAGLVDTKVVAFSTTKTALKTVIPVSRRHQRD